MKSGQIVFRNPEFRKQLWLLILFAILRADPANACWPIYTTIFGCPSSGPTDDHRSNEVPQKKVEVPTIEHYKDALLVIAETAPTRTKISTRSDLNKDGNSDQISIEFKNFHYIFQVTFGGVPNPAQTQELTVEVSKARQEYYWFLPQLPRFMPDEKDKALYLSVENGQPSDQVNWNEVFVRFRILEPFLSDRGTWNFLAPTALLLRSQKFQELLLLAQKNRYTIVFDNSAGALLSPSKKQIVIGLNEKVTTFLQAFPHELQHITNSKSNLDSVKDFVVGKLKSEVDSDKIAFAVLNDIGLVPTESWLDTFTLYEAYRTGHDRGLFEAKKKQGDTYNYVEFNYLRYKYKDVNDSYGASTRQHEMNEIQKIRVTMIKKINIWKELIKKFAQVGHEQFFELDEIRNFLAAEDNTILNQSIQENLDRWKAYLDLEHRFAMLPAPQHIKETDQKLDLLGKITIEYAILMEDYRDKLNEYARFQNLRNPTFGNVNGVTLADLYAIKWSE